MVAIENRTVTFPVGVLITVDTTKMQESYAVGQQREMIQAIGLLIN